MNNISKFLEIAQKKKPNHKEDRVCPDQCVGNIKVLNGSTNCPDQNEANEDFKTRIDLNEFVKKGDM